MTSKPSDEPSRSFDDPELEAVFARSSPADTIAAVLTEARLVLAELDSPLDAELWGSDIVATLDSGGDAAAPALAGEFVAAAERAGTREALAALRVLGVVGPPRLAAAAAEAAGRLAARGIGEPAWSGSIGAPRPGECWRYGDAAGRQEAVTASFWYAEHGHALSVLLDLDQGGGIKDIWVGALGDLLDRTVQMARQDPRMEFEMLTQADARARMDRAIAAGECPQGPAEAGHVGSMRAMLRTRATLLRRHAG